MCVAVPGKIIEIQGQTALVDFNGVKRKVIIGLLSEAKVGMFVIVHAGYAIEVMDEEQAKESLDLWNELIDKEEINPEDLV